MNEKPKKVKKKSKHLNFGPHIPKGDLKELSSRCSLIIKVLNIYLKRKFKYETKEIDKVFKGLRVSTNVSLGNDQHDNKLGRKTIKIFIMMIKELELIKQSQI